MVERHNGDVHSNHDRVTDFEIGIDKVGLAASNLSSDIQDLVIETFSNADKVKGVTIELVSKIPSVKYPLHESNSLRVKFDEAIDATAFQTRVDEAGGLEALLIDVI